MENGHIKQKRRITPAIIDLFILVAGIIIFLYYNCLHNHTLAIRAI